MAPKGAIVFVSEQDVIPTRRSADQTSVGVACFLSSWQPSLVDNVANVWDTPAPAVALNQSGRM